MLAVYLGLIGQTQVLLAQPLGMARQRRGSGYNDWDACSLRVDSVAQVILGGGLRLASPSPVAPGRNESTESPQ